MWIYSQKNGKLFHNDTLIGVGYAGFPPHVNKPEDQCLVKLGPLPRGFYTIGPAYTHPKLGPVCMNLTPDLANDMCNPIRRFFRIHADSPDHPGHSSEGCIVMNSTIRHIVSQSPDRQLQVVKEKS